jgi:hypothetical protein
MQIFVSWSGRPAQVLAGFLQTWLQRVIQELDPFMSTTSIVKGARWSAEIAKRLEETSEAIVCVTTENRDAPWLNFEAGALAKATGSRVRPLLIDLTPSDLNNPLSEFQLTSATEKEDVRRMLEGINEKCDRPLTSELLNDTFEREWPALEAKVDEVIKLIGAGGSDPKRRTRDDDDLMAEILERVRATERLGQVHIDLTSQIYDEMKGSNSAQVPRQARARARAEQLVNKGNRLEAIFEYLKRFTGHDHVRITNYAGMTCEGKLLSIEPPGPLDADTFASINLDGSDGEDEGTFVRMPLVEIDHIEILDEAGHEINGLA